MPTNPRISEVGADAERWHRTRPPVRRNRVCLGQANVARVRKMFEDKGQTFDPVKNSVHAQALNHHGRRRAIPSTALKAS